MRARISRLLGIVVAGFVVTASLPTLAGAAEKLTEVVVRNDTAHPVPTKEVGGPRPWQRIVEVYFEAPDNKVCTRVDLGTEPFVLEHIVVRNSGMDSGNGTIVYARHSGRYGLVEVVDHVSAGETATSIDTNLFIEPLPFDDGQHPNSLVGLDLCVTRSPSMGGAARTLVFTGHTP